MLILLILGTEIFFLFTIRVINRVMPHIKNIDIKIKSEFLNELKVEINSVNMAVELFIKWSIVAGIIELDLTVTYPANRPNNRAKGV